MLFLCFPKLNWTLCFLRDRYNKIEHEDATKSTPFHFAAAHGDTRMVQLPLRSKPSAAYVQDEDGFSAIHVAATAGHPKIIQELLRHCPDFMIHKHNKGRNFLHVTIEKKKLEVVMYVLKSPSLGEPVNEQDDEGNTPLHLAGTSRNEDIIQCLLSSGSADDNVRIYSCQRCFVPYHNRVTTRIG